MDIPEYETCLDIHQLLENLNANKDGSVLQCNEEKIKVQKRRKLNLIQLRRMTDCRMLAEKKIWRCRKATNICKIKNELENFKSIKKDESFGKHRQWMFKIISELEKMNIEEEWFYEHENLFQ